MSALAVAGVVVLVVALRGELRERPAAVVRSRRPRLTPRRRRRPRALAAARGLGLQPLAALRRGAPVPAARRDPRGDLAPAARRPPQPRPARRAPRLAGSRRARRRARRAAQGRGLARDVRDPALARQAHDHPGAPLPAPAVSLAAPVLDPERGAGDLRRHRRGVPRAAPRRAEPAGDRAPARPLAGARPGAVGRRPARARGLRRRDRRDERPPGPLLLRRQISSSRAGSRRCATTARRRRTSASSPASRATSRRTRRCRATAGGSSSRATSRSCRSRSSAGRSACSRDRPARRRRCATSPRGRARRTPRSAYNPTISADGRRVAYESAEGNLNFAKRYGRIGVFVCDLKTGRTQAMPMPRVRAGVSLSGYNPVISADGRRVAYQAQRRGGAERGLRRPTFAPAADARQPGRALGARRRRRRLRPGDLRRRALRRVHDGGVEPRRRRPARPHAGLRPRPQGAHDDARQPGERAARRDRRRLLRRSGGVARRAHVAFSSAARNLGAANRGSRVFVRDLRTRRTRAVSGADGFALEPSISADGRAVAYTSIADGVLARARPRRARARARAPRLARERPHGRARRQGVVRRDDPADGRRVAFTSAATNLAAGKPDDRRGVFVRDLRAQTTTLVSPPVPKAALAAAAAKAPVAGPQGVARRASCRGAARRCRGRPSSRSSTTRSSAAATGPRCACAPAAC